MNTKPYYIVMTAQAHMPQNCWGRYRRVAVVKLKDPLGPRPKMISERAKNVACIVYSWERCNVGTTKNCAYQRALMAAESLAQSRNQSTIKQEIQR